MGGIIDPEQMSDHDLLIVIATKLDAYMATSNDHDRRLRSLERWMWSIPPTLLMAIAAVVAAVVQGHV